MLFVGCLKELPPIHSRCAGTGARVHEGHPKLKTQEEHTYKTQAQPAMTLGPNLYLSSPKNS
ncbi:hypothetical protein BgiBS90_001240, partial [Biomphalaria glabrata]